MNRAIEAGIIPTTGILKEDSNIPKVTRDARGRIRWKLPGNTAEQNERLGIENIQGLFFEKFPEFNELFPRREDGKIAEEKREEAKQFISIKLQKYEDFTTVIGNSASLRNACPYFNGVHMVALQKSFQPWGIIVGQQRTTWAKLPGGIEALIKRIEEEVGTFISEGNGLTESALRQANKTSLLSAIRDYYPGQLSALQSRFEVVPKQHPSKYWTQEVIREEARQFYQQHGDMNVKLVRTNKKHDLLGAIYKHYPGKLRQLLIDIGINPKKHGYWTKETIEREALEIYNREGFLSQSLLSRIGRDDLRGAIAQKYPGTMTALRKKLGITLKSENTISSDVANEELMKFLEAEDE